MFSALIYLAFKAQDVLAGAIFSGAMIVLGGSHLFHVSSRGGGAEDCDEVVCAGMGGDSAGAESAAGGLVGCLSGSRSGSDSSAAAGLGDSDGDADVARLDWSTGGFDETAPRGRLGWKGGNGRGYRVKALPFPMFLAHCFSALASSPLSDAGGR